MSIDKDNQPVAEPTVRLCMLRTWPQHFDGYGFNLHAEKSKLSAGSGGQFIGKVDVGSPAESAGLREGDRIVQVDGVDIEGKSHSTVVALIKKGHSGETGTDDPDNSVSRSSLLVVDRRADTYYREKGIRVHSNMGLQVLVLRTPEEPTPECLSLQQNAKTPNTTPTNNDDSGEPQKDAVDTAAATGPTAAVSTATTAATANSAPATLNLNMTAAELRRRLAETRKQDARRTGCPGDFRQKHELVDKL